MESEREEGQAFVRRPDKLTSRHERLRVATGDAIDKPTMLPSMLRQLTDPTYLRKVVRLLP